jgi:hypothetical protein
MQAGKLRYPKAASVQTIYTNMKFQPGDDIVVNLTNEDGKVIEILNEKMVMIEVKGVKFPAYLDQIDFPYFKMFTQKKLVPKKQVFIDDIKKEKKPERPKTGNGVSLMFIPIFDKDIFDDDVVEKFRLYLVNQNNEGYQFTYTLVFNGEPGFEFKNSIAPHTEFYLHDVQFEDLSDNPKFGFEFSLTTPVKNKAEFYEAAVKLKGKQIFKKIEELQLKNEPSFSFELFKEYPDHVEEEKVDLSKLGNAGFRLYDASRIKENLPGPRTVVDLHIEKLTNNWQHMSNFEILTLQLKTFEQYYDLAMAHRHPVLTVIHGVGKGKLKEEIHELLRLKKEVSSFVNQYTASFGYGATEIFFNYR